MRLDCPFSGLGSSRAGTQLQSSSSYLQDCGFSKKREVALRDPVQNWLFLGSDGLSSFSASWDLSSKCRAV
jgi:hypothetical protein